MKRKCASLCFIWLTILSFAFLSLGSCGKRGAPKPLGLNENYDYKKIKSLSAEALEKLSAIRPKSIGQASRISGVSPSDVSILMVHMKK